MLLGVILPILPAVRISAQSFVATYNFDQVTTSSGVTDPSSPPTAAGLTLGAFTAVGYTPSNPNAAGRFSWTSNPLGGINGSDNFSQFGGSLNLSAYFEVSITPLNQIAVQVNTLAFTVQRSGTGIRSYAVRSSLDGYANNLPASISPANANLAVAPNNEFQWVLDTQTGAQNGSVVTFGIPHASLTAPVTFRFYGWNAEAGTGTFSVDNVSFSGSTRSVPEPTVTAIFALVLGAWGVCQHRKA